MSPALIIPACRSGRIHWPGETPADPKPSAFDLIGQRWTLSILIELMLGRRGFSDLRQSITSISANILSARLTQLQAANIVTRWPTVVSRRHHYELTETGYAAEPAICALLRWDAAWHPSFTHAASANALLLTMKARLASPPPALIGKSIGLGIEGRRFIAVPMHDGLSLAQTERFDTDAIIRAATFPDLAARLDRSPQRAPDAKLVIEGDLQTANRFLDAFQPACAE